MGVPISKPTKTTKAEVFGASSMDDRGNRAFLLKYTCNGNVMQTNLPLAPDVDKQTIGDFRQSIARGRLYQLEDHTLYTKDNYTVRVLDGHLRIKLNDTVYELKLSSKRDVVLDYLDFLTNS